jgi:hypothetical protein
MHLIFGDICHFRIVFLLHLLSGFAPINFQLDDDTILDLFYNFDGNGGGGERFDKTVINIHREKIFLIGFDLKLRKNKL